MENWRFKLRLDSLQQLKILLPSWWRQLGGAGLKEEQGKTGRWLSAMGVRGRQRRQMQNLPLAGTHQKGNPLVAGALGVGLPEGRRNSISPRGTGACEHQLGTDLPGPDRHT